MIGAIASRAVLFALLVAGAGAVTTEAGAQNPATRPPGAFVGPTWKTHPDEDQMGEAYPGFAGLIGVSGRVALRCVVGVDGRLSDCEVLDAQPPGLGFEAAALSLTASMEAYPATYRGAPVPSYIRFRHRFSQSDDGPVPPYAGPPPTREALNGGTALAAALFDFWAPKLPALEVADEDLDVADDRRAFVLSLLEKMDAELTQPAQDALALGLARMFSHPDIQRFLKEGGTPPDLDDDAFEAAMDQLWLAEIEAVARVRSRYCATYPCDIPED